MMFVNPAAPRPISAGIQPELDWIASTASTLKFEKVAPPISGSLMSAPSMANTASTPRCPLMANCAVAARFAPAAGILLPAERARCRNGGAHLGSPARDHGKHIILM